MILWSIQISIVSILLIIIIHNLFLFLQNHFSIPIIKDFVELPQKYENMLNIIEERHEEVIQEEKQEEEVEKKEEKEEENIDMKNELKNFLKSIV